MAQRHLSDYSCLSFDCYGTLIDWETGIVDAFRPITDRLSQDHEFRQDSTLLLEAFMTHEINILTRHPKLDYQEILGKTFEGVAADCGVLWQITTAEKTIFAASIGTWKPFPDTISSLQRLQKHFKLVVLSDVDKRSFAATLSGPLAKIKFDNVHVAEEIQSYKPDLRNFRYLIARCKEDLQVEKQRILHMGCSLPADLFPAHRIGLSNGLIERYPNALGYSSGNLRNAVPLDFVFPDMKALADAADEAFST
ncbi:haloacid dehalogenase type II [Microdochium nivale]|nr:haloacid dehalogenase type II [Microdochium nivale]